MSEARLRSGRGQGRRRLRLRRALRADAVPHRADAAVRDHAAAVPVGDQSLQRDAAGVDHRLARGRHDLRDPDRRHRSLGRLAARLRRAGGRGGRQGRPREPLHRRRGRRRLRLGRGRAGGDRGRARRRLSAGARDHPAQGAAVRGDARRHVGLSRRGASVRRRRPDLRLPAVVHLVGPGQDRPGADPGHHLSRRAAFSPISSCATPATAGRSMRSAAIRRPRASPDSTSIGSSPASM